MPSIGTLVGFLRLDDAQYNRALKASESRTRAFAAGLSSKFLSIAGPTALIGSLGVLAKRALDTADRFDTLAGRINASFEGVQVLETLGRDFGKNADLFTAAGDRIQQALAEVANGNQETAKTFRMLGVDVGQLQNLKLERQLEVLARAVVNATNEQQAFLAVADLIGAKAAPQLKQALIALGTEGYDALRQKTVQTVGLMTEEQGKQLAKAKRDIEDFINFLTLQVGQGIGAITEIRAHLNRPELQQKFEALEGHFDRLNQALNAGIATPKIFETMRAVSELTDQVISQGEAIQLSEVLGAQTIIRTVRATLEARGLLTADALARIEAAETKLTERFETLSKARTAAEQKAAEARTSANQQAADAAEDAAMKERAAAAFKMRSEQAIGNIMRRAQEGAEGVANDTERAARAAGNLAKGFDDAANAAGRFQLEQLQAAIEGSGGGRPNGTNASRSAQKALDRARVNAARGNIGAAQADVRRVRELTGSVPPDLESILAGGAAPGAAPVTSADAAGGAAGGGDLISRIDDLIEALTAIGDKLTVGT